MNVPERLGKYPITGILGRGAMGIVYRGYDPVIKRQVAIKTIRRELIDDDDKAQMVAARFRKEAQAAGALNHPGIVSVYEYGEDEQYAYIAMECVEGNSLREYFTRQTAFDERDIVSLMSQLLDALEFAHNHAVWHRDVKPANVIIMGNGRIKLADFGIARIDTLDRTQTSVVMGTPGYIAPEYYLGRQIDHRVDIFSAGVLFYHLLAGQAPFKGTAEAIMHSVCYYDPEPASRMPTARCHSRFDSVVARALMKRAEDRFPSAGAFRSAILAQYDQPVSESVSEATIISDRARPAAAAEPSQLTGRSQPNPTPTIASTAPPTGWDASVLARIERELTKYVGPVARVLVRRSARDHQTLAALSAALAESLPNGKDRDAFLTVVNGPGTPTPMPRTLDPSGSRAGTAPPSGGRDPISAEDIERATRALTQSVGPIAKVLVKRTAAEGLGRRDFLNRLAQHVASDADRARFLREAGL